MHYKCLQTFAYQQNNVIGNMHIKLLFLVQIFLPGIMAFVEGMKMMTSFQGENANNIQQGQIEINLECVENCPLSDHLKDILIGVICTGCGSKGISEGRAYFEGRPDLRCRTETPCIVVENKNTLIRIKSGSIHTGTFVNLVFETRNRKFFYSISTKGSFIFTRCIKNCGAADNSKEKIFQAKCGLRCNETESEPYWWEFNPTPINAVITEGNQNETLKIPPNSFPPCTNVQVTLKKGLLGKFTTDLGMTPCVPSSTEENSIPIEYHIIEETIGHMSHSLPTLIEKGRYEEIGLAATILLADLKSVSDESFRKHFLRHIVAHVSSIAAFIPLRQLLSILQTIICMEQIPDPQTILMTAEILNTAVQGIFISNASNSDVDVKMTVDVVFQIASEINNASAKLAMTNMMVSQGNLDYPSYIDLLYPKVAYTQCMRKLAFSFIQIIRLLGKLTPTYDNKVGVMTSNNIFTTTMKLPWRSPETITTPRNRSKVIISQSLAYSLSFFKDPVHVQVATFKVNPFWWDEMARNINTEVIMINAYSGNRSITNLEFDIEIILQQNHSQPGQVRGELPLDQEPSRVYRIDVDNGSLLAVYFRVLDQEYYSLVSEFYPSLAEIRSIGKRMLRHELNEWTIHVNSSMAYIAVARRLGKPTKYELTISSVKCISWESSRWEWNSSNCRIKPNITSNMTHCICNHLSLFGGSFLVPPNKISIYVDAPFLVILERSRAVIITLSCVLVLYVLLLVWAAQQDNKLGNRGIRLLQDRVPGDEFPYLVCVETGLWRASGTSAHVAIQLLGDDFCSRVHLLGKGALNQGNEDWFVLHAPRHLGNIHAVRLFHDSFGKKPHWFCERVSVTDLISRKKYIFVAQRWLSLIFSDCQVERVIPQSEKRKLRKGRVLFPQHAQTEIRDSHLWLSVFTRTPDSTFTSKERVTSAFAVFLLSLLASAMFYGANEGLDPQGAFFITLRELAIVVESIVVTVPLGVVITMLFRKSRPFPS